MNNRKFNAIVLAAIVTVPAVFVILTWAVLKLTPTEAQQPAPTLNMMDFRLPTPEPIPSPTPMPTQVVTYRQDYKAPAGYACLQVLINGRIDSVQCQLEQGK